MLHQTGEKITLTFQPMALNGAVQTGLTCTVKIVRRSDLKYLDWDAVAEEYAPYFVSSGGTSKQALLWDSINESYYLEFDQSLYSENCAREYAMLFYVEGNGSENYESPAAIETHIFRDFEVFVGE